MDAVNFNNFKISEAYETWELQSGYPVIHVRHNNDLKHFEITQKRYLNVDSNNIDSSSWFIPLNFAHANNLNFDDTRITHYFMNGTYETTISTANIEGFDDNEWFLFNKQQLSYYRVNYDTENWHNIIRVLNSDDYHQIHVLNRAQLVDDAFNFAFNGHISFDIAFGLLTYLKHETDYLPWASANNYLDRLDYLLLGSNVREAFLLFVNHLVTELYSTHGLVAKNGEEFLNQYAREFAINWSCRTGNRKCLLQTSAEVDVAMNQDKSIPAPLEITFICNTLREGEKVEEFVYFWQKLRATTDQNERLRIIDGLACAKNPQSIKSFLESSTGFNSDVDYRLHERSRIFNSILSSSSVGISTILDFLSTSINDAEFA